MSSITLLAPAKVNLGLEVLGRRDDGYHEVRTILQAIDLSDELTLRQENTLSLVVEPPGSVPVEGNLVLHAAERLRRTFGVAAGAALRLRKRIPVAAGLGGGSSDAAATLLGLVRLWGLNAGLAELTAVAEQLGSDVPFFLRGGTALAEGRGERLSPLPRPVERFAVVLVPQGPDDGAKTGRLYGLLRSEHYSDGDRAAAIVRRLRSGRPIAGGMVNSFQTIADHAFIAYSSARAAFLEAGARHVLLSGAGPALFALANEWDEAQALVRRLVGAGYEAHAAGLLPPWDGRGYEGP